MDESIVLSIGSQITSSNRSWVGSLLVLATLDVLLNVNNLAFFTFGQLSRSLVIGDIPYRIWISQCFFTGVAILMFLLETLNTVSVLYRKDGMPLTSLRIELMITLTTLHIPLSAVNYFIFTCRQNNLTCMQITSTAARLSHILGRLLWHAHLKGRVLKSNEDYPLHRLQLLLICMLIATALAFPVQTWRLYRREARQQLNLNLTSIFIIPGLSDASTWFDHIPADRFIRKHGPSFESSRLVRSIETIRKAGQNGTIVTFACPQSKDEDTYFPLECSVMGSGNTVVNLVFKFVFLSAYSLNPYGAIHYNMGVMRQTTNITDSDAIICQPASSHLARDWKLHYLTAHDRHGNISLSSPEGWSCVPPSPYYDTAIAPCNMTA